MKFIDTALEDTISHKIPDILKEKKVQSANALKALKKFPPRSEEWKYTSFRHLNDLLYSQKLSVNQSLSPSFKEKKGNNILFKDGVCNIKTAESILPKGISIKSFTDWCFSQNPHSSSSSSHISQIMQNELFQPFAKQEDVLEHLNILLCKDIYVITVDADTSANLLLYCHFQQQACNMIASRLFFHLQKGSQLKVFIHIGEFENLERQKITEDLSMLSLRAKLEEKSHLDIYCKQYIHSKSTFLMESYFDLVGKDSHLQSFDIQLGKGHLRNNKVIDLKGINSQSYIHALSLLKNQSHFDSHFYIQHLKPETLSRLNVRSILSDISRYVFNGWICINKEAQKSDSNQISKSLILNPLAEADVKPELDVFADDVKATHGATVGQLDEDDIFYLQSRGLSYKEAIQSLSTSFLQALLMKISDQSLKQVIEKEVFTYFNDMLSQ